MSYTSTKPFGLVLYAWFPEHNCPNQPGTKYRPVVVLDVNSHTQEMLVAYGTSQGVHSCGVGEFIVDADSVDGLTKTTKFCVQYYRWIPATDNYLAYRDKRNVLGKIPTRCIRDLVVAAREVFNK